MKRKYIRQITIILTAMAISFMMMSCQNEMIITMEQDNRIVSQEEENTDNKAVKDSYYAIFEAVDEQGNTVQHLTDKEKDSVLAILRTRLDNNGLTEAYVTLKENSRFELTCPVKEDDNTSWEELFGAIGNTAKLTFCDYTGAEIMDGYTAVKSAKAENGEVDESGTTQHYISIELTDKGQEIFAAETERISLLSEGNNYISICIDDVTISSPSVNERIDSSSLIISGNFNAETAQRFASQIDSGILPYKLEIMTYGKTSE